MAMVASRTRTTLLPPVFARLAGVWLLFASSTAALMAAYPSIHLGWLALAVALAGLAQGLLLPLGTRRPADVSVQHLWDLDADAFERLARLVMVAARMDVIRREQHGGGVILAARWLLPASPVDVFALVVHAPEVEVAMVQGLVTRMRAHGAADGIIFTSGTIGPAARAAAGPWQIRLVDGDAFAHWLTEEGLDPDRLA